MGFVVEGKNLFDGEIYRASIISQRRRVFIPPFRSHYFYCNYEVSVVKKRHPLIEIISHAIPGQKCVFEISDYEAPFSSDEELKSLVEYLIINEDLNNIHYDSIDNSTKDYLLQEYKIDRHIGPKAISLPLFRRIPVIIFIRQEEGWNTGELAKTIFDAFLEEHAQKLEASHFEAYLKREFNNSSNCDLLRDGYKIRLIERQIVGTSKLTPTEAVNVILSSNKTAREKIEELVNCFDDHGIVGLGEPIWPYILASVEQIHEVCNRIITMALEAHHIPKDSMDYNMAEELWHRLIASGYAYRVAEELVN